MTPVVPVLVTGEGFDVPGPQLAGLTTFRVSTPDSTGHKWGAFVLRDGASLPDFLSAMTRSFSWNPEQKAQGSADVNRLGRLVGGVNVYQEHGPADFTLVLQPGTYYFLDYDDVTKPDLAGRVRALTVEGTAVPPVEVPADAVIEAVGEGPDERFVLPDTVPAHGAIMLRNHTEHPQEAVFGRILPESTDEDVLQWLRAYRSGESLERKVFVGAPAGCMPVSTGETAVVRFGLPTGRYAVFSFSRNPHTGQPGAYGGMRRIVTFA